RRPVGQTHQAARDIRPGLAVILRDVHEPVVAAGPQDPLLLRRLGEGEHGAKDLDAGVVARDRPAGPLLFILVVSREIAADLLPTLTCVTGAKDDLAGVIDDLRVLRRDENRGGPLEAILHLGGRDAARIPWPCRDVAGLTGAAIVARQVATVFARINNVF